VAALALAATLGLFACEKKTSPPDEGSPAAAAEAGDDTPAGGDAGTVPDDTPAEAPPAAAPLSYAEDSAREERAFERRKRSMESYESCMEKVASIEEPARTTLRQACARSRRPAQP